jgi:hypothetical protein
VNRKLLSAALAVLAAAGLVALGALGPTGADPIASTDVPANHVGVGALQLDLSGGSASTALSFDGLFPGGQSRQLFWVARNDDASSMPGTLSISFDHLIDTPAPCDISIDKARAEVASGVTGCTIAGDHVSGTPSQGNLSRKVALDVRYVPATDAGGCTSGGGPSLLSSAAPGNLRAALEQSTPLRTPDDDAPLLLAPGQGLCIEAIASWPETPATEQAPDPQHPSDNAAQDDSFRVRARFVLSQVGS